MGQPAITLNADASANNPPEPAATFSGPVTVGGTTIAVDGSTTIGSNLSPQPASVLNVNGNVTATSTTTIVGGVPTTTGGNITASGYVQPAGYDDAAQPACGPTNQGALIYSTTRNTALVCDGTAGKWVTAFGKGQYTLSCGIVRAGVSAWCFAIDSQTGTSYMTTTGSPGWWSLWNAPALPPGQYTLSCGIVTAGVSAWCFAINSQTGTSYMTTTGSPGWWSFWNTPALPPG
jgi:hypothetical protein